MKFVNVFVLAMILPLSAFGYGLGYSTHPLRVDKHIVTSEITGVTSTGGGIGIQGRYSRKMTTAILLDGGFGLGSGDRSNRFFVGGDFELLPDYQKQPRVSFKAAYENAKEFDSRRSIISLAPTVSKGFSFWGYEAYPFLSIPFGLNLTSDSKSYETQFSVAAGATGPLPVKDMQKWLANFELNVGLKDSYTAFILGLTYQLN